LTEKLTKALELQIMINIVKYGKVSADSKKKKSKKYQFPESQFSVFIFINNFETK
jgi:hypothetical protein